MIDAQTVPDSQIPSTARMIKDAALARGWKVSMYYVGSSNMRLERPDGKQLEIFSATPPTTSFVAANRANDKFFTHVLLEESGLPVAETYLVHTESEALEKAQNFFDDNKQCVFKPLDSGHGKGITVGVGDTTIARIAFGFAQQFSKGVIIQEHMDAPIDIRVTCINYKQVASLVRIPARVMGDGKHTVGELIDIENASEHRGENYIKLINVIDKERAAVYLGEKINIIPVPGEWVQVLGTANVGTGGETLDVTENLPKWLIEQAEAAASATQLLCTGVDFLLKTMPTPVSTPDDLQPIIVEVNKCPSLFIHEAPTHGQPRPVVKAYLDYLETL